MAGSWTPGPCPSLQSALVAFQEMGAPRAQLSGPHRLTLHTALASGPCLFKPLLPCWEAPTLRVPTL